MRVEGKPEALRLVCQTMEWFHQVLQTPLSDLPNATNFVDQSEGLRLGDSKGPSGLKLSDPESSVRKGQVVDISLEKAPLTMEAEPFGTQLMQYCVSTRTSTDLARFLTEGAYNMPLIGLLLRW